MRRIGPAVALLTVALIALVALVGTPGPAAHAAPPSTPPPTPEPVTTANEFLPENENLSDCIGVLERPGCGSEARGGWRQSLVFVLMAVGLVLIFGRVGWAVRKGAQRTREG